MRKHITNDDERFPRREVKTFYNFGNDSEAEWLVDEIVDHEWKGNTLRLRVKWDQGDATWESLKDCEDLEALDDYLELWGVKEPHELPCERKKGCKAPMAPATGGGDGPRPRGGNT